MQNTDKGAYQRPSCALEQAGSTFCGVKGKRNVGGGLLYWCLFFLLLLLLLLFFFFCNCGFIMEFEFTCKRQMSPPPPGLR